MNFTRFRERYIDASEMNSLLRYTTKYYNIVFGSKGADLFKRTAYIEDGIVNFKLTLKIGSIPCTYICRKDSMEVHEQINGGEAFRILSTFYKVPRVDKKFCGRADEGGMSASPIIWYNPKYECQWVDAYGYDMNSAYSFSMLEDMPDTSVPLRSGQIKEGIEIGFEEILNPKNPEATMLVPKYKGFSLYIFPLMESPFKRFVEIWYSKKINSEPGSSERIKAKGVLNFSIGQLQNINPFLRATIIGKCNERINKLIDDDTLYCNTDSIVSRRKLNLDIGTNVGQWKLEHEGKFAYKGFNYQWKNGDVSYRHVPKSWFPADWDITMDELPVGKNLYRFDKESCRLQKNEKS